MKLSELAFNEYGKGTPIIFRLKRKDGGWYDPDDQKDTNAILLENWLPDSKEVTVLTLEENSKAIKIPSQSIVNYSYLGMLRGLFKFKILASEESVNLFAYKNIKEKLIGEFVTLTNIEKHICKKDGKTRLIAEVSCPTLGKNIKFSAVDIDVILPNLDSYKPKFDRTLRQDVKLKCVDDRKSEFVKGDIYTFDGIYSRATNKTKESKYIRGVKSHDAILVSDKNGKKLIGIVKRFKVIA